MKYKKKLVSLLTALTMLAVTSCGSAGGNESGWGAANGLVSGAESNSTEDKVSAAADVSSTVTDTQKHTDTASVTASAADESSEVYTPANTGETVTLKEMSFDTIACQCSECEKSLKYLAGITKAFNYIHNDGNKKQLYLEAADEAQQKFHSSLRHNCSAEVINVENIPYMINHYFGMYTGQWKGAGPCGKGTFVGFDKADNLYHATSYTYTGEWNYGLPNGTGDSYEEAGFGGNYTYYHGGMVDGKRCGTGSMCQEIAGYNRYYNETSWYNDNLAVETDVAEYDSHTGELYCFGTMIADQDYVSYTKYTYAKDAADKRNAVFGIVATVGACMLLSPIIDGALDTVFPTPTLSTDEEQQAMLEQWRSEEARRVADIEEAQERAANDYRDYAYSKMKDCEKAGDTYSLDYQYWSANAY